MCGPQAALPIIGIGLSAAGALNQGRTQARYVEAVNRANREAWEISKAAREAERVRQDELEAANVARFDETLAGLDRTSADKATDEGSEDFTRTLAAIARPQGGEAGFLLPGQGESSVAVKDWVAKEAASQAGEAKRRIAALARLTGSGSTAGERTRSLGGAQDDLNINNGLRRGSLGVSRFEQNIPAARVTPGSPLLGDILSGAGKLAGSFGGPGGFSY